MVKNDGALEVEGEGVDSPLISSQSLKIPTCDCHNFRRDFSNDFGTLRLGGECWGEARSTAFGKSANWTKLQTLWVAALKTEHNT